MRALFITILLFITLESNAGCRVKCYAKYARHDKANGGSMSYSTEYYVEVNFMTGKELYESTLDSKYLGGQYAVIFWAPNEATVIKLTTSSASADVDFKCGDRINCQCFPTWLIFRDGTDQQDRYWIISNKKT